MNIDIIGVPLYYGCDKKGVEKGPEYLRANGLINKCIIQGHDVTDLGDIEVKEILGDSGSVNAKYIEEIVYATNNLAKLVNESIDNKHLPIIIGGDHSLALGSLAGISKALGNDVGVVWIDAHGDLNTAKTSPTGNIHGMPLAASMGIGEAELCNIYFDGIKVKSENVFIIACRDLDEGEIELIKRLNLNVWDMKSIEKKGINQISEELIEKLNILNDVHISFDIDSIDPKYIIGTGTPVKNGLTVSESQFIIEAIIKTKKVKSIDFVEFNPEIETKITLNNCEKIIGCILKSLKRIEE